MVFTTDFEEWSLLGCPDYAFCLLLVVEATANLEWHKDGRPTTRVCLLSPVVFMWFSPQYLQNGLCLVARLRVFVCCLWMKRLGMDARPSHVVFTTAFAEWSLLGARLRLFACCLVARRETVTCGFHHSICCPTTRFYLLLVVEAKARLGWHYASLFPVYANLFLLQLVVIN